jgi:NTP pyrophosphatase (non-canonical NTP hydrolase)
MSNRAEFKGWIWGEETEAYLDKFDQVQRLTARIRFVAAELGEIAELLRCNPQKAYGAIRKDWPTRDQLREMIKEWEDAKAQLPNYWNRLSEEIRRAIDHRHPEMATDVRMRSPDD